MSDNVITEKASYTANTHEYNLHDAVGEVIGNASAIRFDPVDADSKLLSGAPLMLKLSDKVTPEKAQIITDLLNEYGEYFLYTYDRS